LPIATHLAVAHNQSKWHSAIKSHVVGKVVSADDGLYFSEQTIHISKLTNKKLTFLTTKTSQKMPIAIVLPYSPYDTTTTTVYRPCKLVLFIPVQCSFQPSNGAAVVTLCHQQSTYMEVVLGFGVIQHHCIGVLEKRLP